ncbi:MAG: pentapeptide repeat-containing protein, partial [Elusimicrobia bacterium]|nr:pentapeptide repeat-containing protein [Elusimicrobiota bacterium]
MVAASFIAALLLAVPALGAGPEPLASKVKEAQLAVSTRRSEEPDRFKFVDQGSWYVCRDEAGEPGRNSVPVPTLRKVRQGYCGNFTGAELEGLDLKGVDLKGADLNYARLTGTVLKGAQMKWADANYARFDKTDLSQAHGTGAR